MSRRQFTHGYDDIISYDNLFAAWQEFLIGKSKRADVQEFQYCLLDNIQSLHSDLRNKVYKHGLYHAFGISDPKPRQIHKASVRDRILHHAVYLILYPFFDRTFIADSYSCRDNKGTHRALNRFQSFARKVSRNHKRTCWVLKCDIRKFFASIDQNVLRGILQTYIPDKNILGLLDEVISSFNSTERGKGLPLGNLTSQLLVNIYMNEFDQFVKHKLKAKQYIRYADDFVLLSDDKDWLQAQVSTIALFLHDLLALSLHPDKVSIRSLASGVDFLGWVHFPDHRVLRSATARRMSRRIKENPKPETMQSYLGLLQHGNTQHLRKKVLNEYELLREK